MYDYGARMYMPDIGRWGVMDELSELQFHYSPYSYVYNNPVFFNDPTGMIGEPCEKCPKPNESQNLIEEVVITAYQAITSVDWDKTMRMISPITIATPEEIAMSDAKYGKCGPSDIGCDFSKLWKQTKDLPGYFASVPGNLVDGISSIAESEDAEEIIVSSVILAVNLKKGKLANVAKMGAVGGKFIHIGGVKLLTETFHKVTKPKILSQSGDFMKKVGKNPNINVNNTGNIILEGQGPFKGKTFQTTLKASDYLT